MNMVYRRAHALVMSLLVFLAVFLLYFYTLSPTIFPGDATELVTAIGVRGVAHPPGYPFFTLLGILMSLLPHAPLPLLINLLSALFGASAIGLLAFLIFHHTRNHLASCIASILLAITTPFWLYSVTSEVFTLHALLIVALLLALRLFLLQSGSLRASLLIGIFALHATNHHTTALLTPLLIYVLVSQRKHLHPYHLFALRSLVAIVIGLLPYIYVVVAARGSPLINWDAPTSFSALMQLVLRRDYGTLSLAPTLAQFTPHTTALKLLLQHTLQDSWGILPLLAACGVYWLWNHERRSLLIYGSAWVLLGPVFMVISDLHIASIAQRGNLGRFFVAPDLLLTVIAGFGLAYILSIKSGAVARALQYSAVFLLTPALLIAHLPATNQKDNTLYYSTSSKIFSHIPQNAVVVTISDIDTNAFDYLQFIEKKRHDVILLTLPKLSARWYREQIIRRHGILSPLITDDLRTTMHNLCEYSNTSHPVVVAAYTPFLDDIPCAVVPEDAVLVLKSPRDIININEYINAQRKFFFGELQSGNDNKKIPHELHTARVLYEISDRIYRTGAFILSQGNKIVAQEFFERAAARCPYHTKSLESLAMLDLEKGNRAGAITRFKEIIARNPETPLAYYNLGILYSHEGKKNEARKYFSEFLSFKSIGFAAETAEAQRRMQSN